MKVSQPQQHPIYVNVATVAAATPPDESTGRVEQLSPNYIISIESEALLMT